MKLGIIGLAKSGRSTIFEALTHSFASSNNRFGSRLATIKVADNRLDMLSNMYNPKKTVHAQIEYFLPERKKNNNNLIDQNNWSQIRNCDALVHVIKNFNCYGVNKPSLYSDFVALNQDLILSDTLTVENRLERLALEKKRGGKIKSEELILLRKCLDKLEREMPLRNAPEIVSSKLLRGYSFLSSKPVMLLVNNDENNDSIPENSIFKENHSMVVRGKLEQELAQMSEEDSKEFLNEYNILEPATAQIISASYTLLGLVSFFTVGEDEVRAWTVKANTTALDAAKVIHSDIKKGFIRAEVVSYNAISAAGTYSNARKKGTVRLEGKTYIVRDGDIINFRFNV